MPKTLAPADLGTILSVWAHPDDETYLAGGVMAAASDAGQIVVCASATAGEHGTDDPSAWPPERLAELRMQESAEAAEILGLSDTRWLGFEDGTLESVDAAKGLAAIEALISEIEPDTILTFGPEGMTGHSDHRTVSNWVTDAWQRLGGTGRLFHACLTADHLRTWGEMYEEWGIFMTEDRPTGVEPSHLAIAFRLDDALLARKVAALRAMASQTSGILATVDADTFAELHRWEWFVEWGGGPGSSVEAGSDCE